MRPLSPKKRNIILKAAHEAQSTRQIANSLNIHHSTVARTIKKAGQRFQPYFHGRPKKLTVREERVLIRKVISGEWPTAVEAQKHLKNDYNIHLTARSIQNALRRNGLKGRVRKKKPLLKKKHRQRRYSFGLRHRKWSLEQWNKIIWSDESKFSIFGSDGRQYCWRYPGQWLLDHHVIPTVKHGGGAIMVWDCMTWQGTEFLCRIEHGIDAELYQTIL